MDTSTEKELESFITPKQEIIYHYTNIPALFNGILTEKDICLWATNAQYMNDPQDILFGINLVSKIFSEYKDIQDDFLTKKEEIIKNSFITSFSYKEDFLPMWSMYGANGSGISLGFNSEIITNENQSFLNCLYFSRKDPEHIADYLMKIANPLISQAFKIHKSKSLQPHSKEKIETLIDSIQDIKLAFIYLTVTIYSAKNAAYSYEEEIRLMDFNPTNIKYRNKGNLIIPYIEQHFPKEALQEITIGPTNDMERSEFSLRTYLDHLGYNHVKIKKSEVPYRG